MNKKGFTLVELLAVIVLLGIVITVVATKGFGAFDNAKEKINLLNKEAIVEGTKVFATEIDNCSDNFVKEDFLETSEGIFREENGFSLSTTCQDIQDKMKSDDCLKTSVGYLKENNYVTGSGIKDIKDNTIIKICEINEKIVLKDEDGNTFETEDIFTTAEKEIANNIITNIKKVTEENNDYDDVVEINYTTYSENSQTSPGNEVSNENERLLLSTQDDYGTSYYYRGNVNDNYLNFANMCWRIVRFEGDGSTKLILEDIDNLCPESNGNWDYGRPNFGYEIKDINSKKIIIQNFANPKEQTNNAMITTLKTFQYQKLNKYLSYLKSGDWCLDDNLYNLGVLLSPYTDDETDQNGLLYHIIHNKISVAGIYYGSALRLWNTGENNPTLLCPKDLNGDSNFVTHYPDGTDMYVGTLTADEVVFAGGKGSYSKNEKYYLVNDYTLNKKYAFYTMTLQKFSGTTDYPYYVANNGALSVTYSVSTSQSDLRLRPSISLKKGVQLKKGDGTKMNPYIVE